MAKPKRPSTRRPGTSSGKSDTAKHTPKTRRRKQPQKQDRPPAVLPEPIATFYF